MHKGTVGVGQSLSKLLDATLLLYMYKGSSKKIKLTWDQGGEGGRPSFLLQFFKQKKVCVRIIFI